MPGTPLLDKPTPVIWRAAALLDSSFEVLADPARWCRDAYATDAAGKPIRGKIVDAVEANEVASRCMFGELLHQGIARGYRIEIATKPGAAEQVAEEVTCAPASWQLAAVALAFAALSAAEDEAIEAAHFLDEREPPSSPMRVGEFVLASVFVNEHGTYEDAIWSLALAAEMLRVELDLRAAAKSTG